MARYDPKLYSQPAIFVQDACQQHQYIRSKDTSGIVERPERLRAVKVGLAVAIARLEELFRGDSSASIPSVSSTADDLADALNRLDIGQVIKSSNKGNSPTVIHSSATVDILNHPAVKFVHGDVDGDVYPGKLKAWASESWQKISNGESEIPEGLSQGDLYLCPESINAIQGALGTVCEAIDGVTTGDSSFRRAFVAVRPPGHHCGEDTPSGFCFVNNVAVGAAHAHLQHGIDRVVIFDIDLHHGNGTQSIAWQINEETYRQKLEADEGVSTSKPGPRIYYGSIHDILSYPCEDGKPNLIQAASTSIYGAHGQYVENIHLQTYTSEEHFDELYDKHYSRLLRKAEDFLDETGGPGDDVLVFISCGMDACEHEYESMSRHNRKVPASFYYRFTKDACAFSDRYAKGKLVSVLEGGYSDRALISGAMAHLSGLADVRGAQGEIDANWWCSENLLKIEKATKKRRGGRPSVPAAGSVEPWLERTIAVLSSLEPNAGKMTPSSARVALPVPTSRTLRDRKKPSPAGSPVPTRTRKTETAQVKIETTEGVSLVVAKEETAVTMLSSASGNESTSTGESSLSDDSEAPVAPKKLPRIILKLGPRPAV